MAHQVNPILKRKSRLRNLRGKGKGSLPNS
jgi:hypothetical protein